MSALLGHDQIEGDEVWPLFRDNLKSLGIEAFSVLSGDAFSAVELLGRQHRQFDIIFLDPPYHKDLAKKTLLAIADYDIIKPLGFVVVQHFKKDGLEDSFKDLTLYKRKTYGTTVVSFYRSED